MKELLPTSDDLFDKIENYYLNGSKLSDVEMKICTRLESSYALMMKHRSKSIAVKKHAKTSGISLTQAYSDFKAAERVFNPLRKYTKEFLRLVIIESAMRDIRDCEKRAKDASISDWDKIMKIKDRAEQRIIKASGLDQDDPNLPDFSKLKPHQYNIQVPREVEKMFHSLLSKGVVDITNVYENISEDAKEVDDGIN